MSPATLSIERAGPVTRVWLDRPERRNALDTRCLEELADCFDGFATDYETRVVVLGGRGPSFCAGADRKQPPGSDRDASTPRARRYLSQLGRRATEAIERCETPTIARLHGHVIGGGVVLALACDFRLAASDTRLLVPEVDLGIPLTWGAAPRLVREVGPLRARELILLCEPVLAETAREWGLVNRVLPAAELDGTVAAWAERLAAKPEAAVHMTKTQLRGMAAAGLLSDATEADGDLLLGASASAEARRSFAGDDEA